MIVRHCLKCGFTGRMPSRFRFRVFIPLFILTAVIFALPALYYALTRRDSYRCPKCGETAKIEVGVVCEHCGYEGVLKRVDGVVRWFTYGLDPDFGVISDAIDSEVRCQRCGRVVGRV